MSSIDFKNPVFFDKKLVLSIVVAGVLSAASVFAQADRGNGGDETTSEDRTAWLVGNSGDSFTYCLDRDSTFQMSDEQFNVRLKRALKGWRSIFISRGVVDETNPNPKKWYPLYSARQVPCDGNEQLKFYLGSTDSLIEIVKKQYRNPTAFHFRLKPADYSVTGKGLIWFSKPKSVRDAFPNWLENEELFDMFLIHELGHAYGIPHIEGTIMTENLVALARDQGKERREIEWNRELISNFPKKMARVYPARSELFEQRFPAGDGGSRVFAFGLFRDRNTIRGSLAQPALHPAAFSALNPLDFRILPDLLSFEFDAEGSSEQIFGTQEILCIPQRSIEGSRTCYKNFSFSVPVSVKDERGVSLPGIFEYNLSRSSFRNEGADLASPYRLKVYLEGSWKTAFEARF